MIYIFSLTFVKLIIPIGEKKGPTVNWIGKIYWYKVDVLQPAL